jgi:hypothetical protein
VLAASSVGYAVIPHADRPTIDSAAPLPDSRDLGTVTVSTREPEIAVSRSMDRSATVEPGRSGVETAAVPEVTDHQWATVTLNVWSGPGEDSVLVDEVEPGTKLAVTGTEQGGWVQVVLAGMPRWVNSDYLSDEDPQDVSTTSTSSKTSTAGVSLAPCPSGSDVESGLTPDAVRVHRAICHAFPQITSYGGLRPGDSGEHGTGQALDVMTSDQALGDEIAAWLIEHRTELGISELLWWQRIWTVERMSEGWRPFSDRGSATANHMDHVHVTVYGDSGTG